jgi:hypothetical protein
VHHVIIPRTVLDRWGATEGASPAAWDRIAPLLDRVWDEATAGGLPAVAPHVAAAVAGPDRFVPLAVLERCVDVALRAETLSLRQALSAAGASAETRECLGTAPQPELTYLREGHASTIVRLGSAWALNVARDTDGAASELAAAERALRSWRGARDVRIPAVGGAFTACIPWFDRVVEVPVLAVEWLEGFEELHVVGTADGPRFVRVAAFQHAPGRGPGMRGTLLDSAASGRIWRAVATARTATALIHWRRGTLRAPELEPNDGDVVADGDGTPGLVGASQEVWEGPVAAWPYVLALSSARDDGGRAGDRLRWADPAAAVGAVLDGLAARGDPGAASAVLTGAADMAPAEAAALAGAAGDPKAVAIAEATRDLCRSLHEPCRQPLLNYELPSMVSYDRTQT